MKQVIRLSTEQMLHWKKLVLSGETSTYSLIETLPELSGKEFFANSGLLDIDNTGIKFYVTSVWYYTD